MTLSNEIVVVRNGTGATGKTIFFLVSACPPPPSPSPMWQSQDDLTKDTITNGLWLPKSGRINRCTSINMSELFNSGAHCLPSDPDTSRGDNVGPALGPRRRRGPNAGPTLPPVHVLSRSADEKRGLTMHVVTGGEMCAGRFGPFC